MDLSQEPAKMESLLEVRENASEVRGVVDPR